MHALANQNYLFPGRLAVQPFEAAFAVFGWSPSTTRTYLCKSKFPLPMIEIGGKKLVRVSDLLKFIENQDMVGNKKKVGHPTKRQQLAKAGLEGGEQ